MWGRVIVCVVCLLAWAGNEAQAQEQVSPLSLILKGNLTTSSQIYPNPNATDQVSRAQSYTVGSFFGYGAEIRYRFPETNVAIGLSADYLNATSGRSLRASPLSVPVEDGYRVIPLEIPGYFLIPVSGPTFGLFMGGGGGIYYGRRTYSVGGLDAPSVGSTPGAGIHVLGGFSWRLQPRFAVTGEMKFRDLQFQGTNKFPVPRVTYQGTIVNVGQEPFDSSIHTDGIVFQLGAAFLF